MNEVKLRTTAHLKAFLAGTELLELHISTVQQRYDFIDRTLKRFSYCVTSRKIARPFYKQMRVACVPPLHSIQGRFTS